MQVRFNVEWSKWAQYTRCLGLLLAVGAAKMASAHGLSLSSTNTVL